MSAPLQAIARAGDVDAPVVVLLHGRGSDERDLPPVGEAIAPGATIVTPRAPFPGAPWGYGGGWAWYRYLGGTTPEPESFVAGQEALAAFLDDLPTRLGRPVPTLVLGGFSQGGTSSLAFALRHPGRVQGVVVFSGFLADHPSVVASPETLRGTPIWWGHGTADGAIPFEHAEAGWAALRAAGADLTATPYPGLGHSIVQQELLSAKAWLRSTVCPTG